MTEIEPDSPPRRYGGKTADERREVRRERLIEAGIELFGTVGFHATSIRSVMRETGLGERYFYESFGSLEELLVVTAQTAQARIKQTVLDALDRTSGMNFEDSLREAMTALAEAFERDPRVLRIAMVETIGVSPTVTKARNDLLEDFVALLAGAAVGFGDIDEPEADLLSVGLLGAANELLMRWTTGQIDADLATVISELEVIFSGTYERAAAKRLADEEARVQPSPPSPPSSPTDQ